MTRPGEDEEDAMERLVTVREAARLTGVTARTIHRWVQKGAVHAYATPGGALRVQPKDCLPQPRAVSGSSGPSRGRRLGEP